MGYDMHMVAGPAAMPAYHNAPVGTDARYFQYSNDGMAKTRFMMVEWAQVARPCARPRFPEWSDSGLSAERGQWLVEWRDFVASCARAGRDPIADAAEIGVNPPADPAPAELAGLEAHARGVDAALCASTIHHGTVAEYKWQSNEGWLVTPEECTIVARGMREHADGIGSLVDDWQMTSDQGRRWAEDWALFNEVAAAHGGYRVR